jgi:hypothetical protein
LQLGLVLVLLVGFASVTRAGAQSGRETPTPAQLGGDDFVQQELKHPVCSPVPYEWTTTWTDRSMFTRVRLADGSRLILRCGNGIPDTHPVLCKAGSSRPIETGSMILPRCLASATLLKNGDVLIAGGIGTEPPSRCDTRDCDGLTSAELYHPPSGIFEAVGNMLNGRSSHTATLLANGKVLIAGGFMSGRGSGYSLAEAELYDPESRNFSQTGSMHFGRADQEASLLRDGHVLIEGGHSGGGDKDGIVETPELYDPATGQFTLVAKPQSPSASP